MAGILEKLAKDRVGKTDFVKAFKSVLAHMTRLQEKLEARVEEKLGTAINSLAARIEKMERGKDGKTPVKGVDYFDGAPGYSPVKGIDFSDGEPGANGSADTGEEIITKVNEDKSRQKIKKEKVEGLAEIEDKAREAYATVNSFGLRMGGDSVYFYDLSTSTDGTTKAFSLSGIQFRTILAVFMSDAPYVLMSANGFTSTASTLTLTVANAPSSGSQLGVLYVL